MHVQNQNNNPPPQKKKKKKKTYHDEKDVLWLPYLHNGISYNGKTFIVLEDLNLYIQSGPSRKTSGQHSFIESPTSWVTSGQ